uniref:Gnk2-homologous domain-containing protein n=1 Tax=Kalanchoe fedtschenkoi TaxID=63787 RepID=A0A7N0ZUH5_KALFE
MEVFLLALLAISAAPIAAVSGGDTTFIYGGCTQQKYPPSSPYRFSLNSLLTTLVSAANYNIYNNFTVTAASTPAAYGLFQCRGDLASDTCSACVSTAISQLGVLCPDSYGAALQLEGCLVKYDSTAFVGAEDKTVVVKRCGPTGLGPSEQVLEYLAGQPGLYRVGAVGKNKGVAQCVGDLSVGECQDCLADAIGRLRSECGGARWGDVFLVKCYARFSGSGDHARTPGSGGIGDYDTNSNDREIQKHLAIIIGIIVGVALIVICFSFINRYLERERHNCK